MLKCNLRTCSSILPGLVKPVGSAGAARQSGPLVLVVVKRLLASSPSSPDQIHPDGGSKDVLLKQYLKMLETNEYSLDQNQLNVVYRLNEFHKQVVRAGEPDLQTKGSKSSFFKFLRPGRWNAQPKSNGPKVKGIYLYGGVGCGKTMLMDMTYDLLPPERTKLRIHFNKFMLSVHENIHALKSQMAPSNPRLRPSTEASMMDILADKLVREHSLLFFDEFQVNGIADAMLMSGLFTSMFERGMVCFFTSNRAPSELYFKGLQRELFLPFIDVLNQYCDVICLDSPVDYRKLTGESLNRVYFNSDSEQFLLNHLLFNMINTQKKWSDDASPVVERTKGKSLEDTLHEAFKREKIEILGREVILERCAGRILDTTFSFLCEESRSSVDYIHLCKMFDVIVVRNVPIVSLNDPNSFRRFISFIDNVYDNRVKLVLSGKSTAPTKLVDRFTKRDQYEEEIFAVDRTISRLIEMQSESYANANKFSNAAASSDKANTGGDAEKSTNTLSQNS